MTEKDVLDLIGKGNPLCVSDVDAFCLHFHTKVRIYITLELAREVVKNYCDGYGEFPPVYRLLGKAVKDDVNQKMGWESCGLPGDTHSVYRFIQ